MTELLILAIATACGAAVRSTWSPCGLSMLSTITPLTERARGHRYGLTVAWFALGALAGGAALGVAAAVLALLVHVGRTAGHCGARHRGGVRRRRPGRRPAPRRRAPADPSAPGQRDVARPLPPLDLRGRVRGADRRRARDLRHDGRGLSDDRARRAERFADCRAGHRHAVRRGTRAGRSGRMPGDDARGDPCAACPPARHGTRVTPPRGCPAGRSGRGRGRVGVRLGVARLRRRRGVARLCHRRDRIGPGGPVSPPDNHAGLPGAVRRCRSTEPRPASTDRIRCLPDRSSTRSRRSA